MQNNIFSTLFVGQNLIKLNAVDSTNTYLKKLLSNSEPLPEGTVIMADHQFAGRGQQDNSWETAPGKNLTFSLFLRPSFIAPHHQFLLNMLISLAINRSLTAHLGDETRIKWPNDIYYRDKKIGGILIENTLVGNVIKAAIIGIGINVNQMSFEEDLADKAISMGQILKKDIHLTALLHSICNEIESLYLQQRGNINNKLRQMYVEKLYRFNQLASYQKNGEVFDGTITGISEEGLLQVDISGRQHEFNFKEIKFLNLF